MRELTTPTGVRMTVRIAWVGNTARTLSGRLRRRGRTSLEAGDAIEIVTLVDDLFAAVSAVVVAVVVVFLIVHLSPLALWVFVLAVAAGAVWIARVLFRRPWVIQQRTADGEAVEQWSVVGWREAHRVMVEVADQLESSGVATPTPPTGGWA